AGETLPRFHPGRLLDGPPLRRDRARPCHYPQARAHDGWRCDGDKRAGQGLGVYGTPAGLAQATHTTNWKVSERAVRALAHKRGHRPNVCSWSEPDTPGWRE